MSRSKRSEEIAEGSKYGHDEKPKGILTEEDRLLPIGNVAKIMKKSVPGKITNEAKICVQECATEFISFLTSEAAYRCQQDNRKTIRADDILYSMTLLDFDNYVEPLKLYMKKYRELSKSDKGNVALSEEGEGEGGSPPAPTSAVASSAFISAVEMDSLLTTINYADLY